MLYVTTKLGFVLRAEFKEIARLQRAGKLGKLRSMHARKLAETGGNWRKLAGKLAETGGNWRKLAETGPETGRETGGNWRKPGRAAVKNPDQDVQAGIEPGTCGNFGW